MDANESAGYLSSDESLKSSSESDLVPILHQQFHNLSSVLSKTNDNLHSFEFMLQQYKQLAKIKPMIQENHEKLASDLNASQLAQNEKMDSIIKDLEGAVSKFSNSNKEMLETERKNQNELLELTRKNAHLEEKNNHLENEHKIAMEKIKKLEEECVNKSHICEQLTDSIHQSRLALNEEREKNQLLDQKLEREKRAAQKVAQDITKYVSQMKLLEDEVMSLRKEKSHNERRPQNIDNYKNMSQDYLNQVNKIQSPRQEDHEKILLKEKLFKYEEQIQDYESQIKDMKKGLDRVQKELEDKCQMIADAEEMHKNVEKLVDNEEKGKAKTTNDGEINRMKNKLKIMLKKYNDKKSTIEKQRTNIDKVKICLKQLLEEVMTSDENYKAILSHLGSEVEILVRLMAAYLNLSISHQPIQIHDRKLSAWFRDIQSLITWLQNQILAFGKRYWTDKENPKIKNKILPLPQIPSNFEELNTISQLSIDETLGSSFASDRNKSIHELVDCQDTITRAKLEDINNLITTLQHDN